jgi:PAS domain S-box-containing protein
MKSKTKIKNIDELAEALQKVRELEIADLERRRVEETLRRAAKERAAILDTVFDFVVLANSNCEIIWTNKAVSRQFGMNPSQLKGMYCHKLFNKIDQPCKDCPAQKAMQTGRPVTVESRSFVGRKWAVRYYPINDEKMILAACTDITERKAAEKALLEEQRLKDELLSHLKESEEKYKMIFEESRDSIFIISKEGKFIDANPACLNLFGINKEELRYVKIWDSVVFTKAKEKFIHDMEEKKSVVDYPAKLRKKDGALIDCLVNASVKRASDGNIVGYQGIIRDITEKKKLEQKVLEISEKERREIGQDLHDGLGQLLTGIALKGKSIAQKLDKRSLPEAKDAQRLTDLVNEAINQTRRLTKGLVPSSLQAGGILTALKEMADNISQAHGIPCTVKTNCLEMDFDIVKANQMYRIAQEATLNAVKHSEAKRISINLNEEDDRIILSIVDDGIGFSFDTISPDGRGLHIMEYRAGMIDATLRVVRNKKQGMTILCAIPRK